MAGGDYGRIRLSFWTDPDVKRKLTAEQKTLLLYYFTSPHSNLAGLFYCPFEYAAAETGLEISDVRTWTLGALSPFLTYDEETEEVFVHAAGKHQIGVELKAKDNRITAILRTLHETHSKPLQRAFVARYPDWPLGFEAPETPDPNPGSVDKSGNPHESSDSEAPSKPLESPLKANAVQCSAVQGNAETEKKGRASAPAPVDEVVDAEVIPPEEPGARVIPFRPASVPDLPFANQDWSGRVSGSVVLQEWIRRQPSTPSTRDRNRYGRVCKRIADDHPTGNIALAFIGIEYIWPHAPPPVGNAEPWTPEDLEKRFVKALPAAKNHPTLKARLNQEQFDRALEGGGW